METSIVVQLEKFEVPLVVRETASITPGQAPPFKETPLREFHLQEIPSDVLEKMCYEFYNTVFCIAKRSPPPTEEPCAPLYNITPILLEIAQQISAGQIKSVTSRLRILLDSGESDPSAVLSVLEGRDK